MSWKYSAIYDKKNVEHEIHSFTELPFSLSTVVYPTGKNQPPNYSAYYNSILQKLKENDLFLEQLTLNVQESKNIYGALVTSDKNLIFGADEGTKFILTAHTNPQIQMVHKVPSEINDAISSVSDLSNLIVNFALYDDQNYVVGTGNGLYYSNDLFSGWKPVDENEWFVIPFTGYNCKACLKNKYQGLFPEELDEFNQYQYLLGTNNGLYGLKTMGVDTQYWRKLHRYELDGIQINDLKFESRTIVSNGIETIIPGKLFIATNIGLFTSDGITLQYENGTNGLNVNTIDFFDNPSLFETNEHILIGTESGFKQSRLADFTKNFKLVAKIENSSNENITCVRENNGNVYFSLSSTIYKVDQEGNLYTEFSDSSNEIIQEFDILSSGSISSLIYRIPETITDGGTTGKYYGIREVNGDESKSILKGSKSLTINGLVHYDNLSALIYTPNTISAFYKSGNDFVGTKLFDTNDNNYIKDVFNCFDKVYGIHKKDSVVDNISICNISTGELCTVVPSESFGLELNPETYGANFVNDDISSLVYSFKLTSCDFDFFYLSSAFKELSTQIDSPVSKIIRDETGLYFYNSDFFAKFNVSAGYSEINVPTRFDISLIDGIYKGENNNIFVTVGKSLYSFNGTELQRIFDKPRGEYQILQKKFYNQNIRSVYKIDDRNFLIGTSKYLRFLKNLTLNLEPKDFEMNLVCSGPVTAMNMVEHATEGGISKKYLYASGRNLFSSENNIEILEETSIGTENLEINSIFCPNGYVYCLCTTEGFWVANMGYVLKNDLETYDVQKIKQFQSEVLSGDLISHIENMHTENDFITAVNKKSPAKLETVPDSYTKNNFSGLYNEIQIVTQDVVEKIEFNDDNKYIKASIQNWALEMMNTANIYSETGFVDQCQDPYSEEVYDFSDIPYVCKFWNSGMKEIVIYVPTTMTYYINNPYGFTNSIYNNDSIPRANISQSFNTTNRVYEKYTILQILLNNVHFQIRSIHNIQINGNSLPLRIYKDAVYCQPGRENLFDTIIQPSVINSIPSLVNSIGGTNVENMKESNNLVLTFSIYGTDSQSIKILAE